MSLDKDNEKQITHKDLTNQDEDKIRIFNEYIRKFEDTYPQFKQRIEQKLRPLSNDQLIQIAELADEQFLFFLKCEYSLAELQKTKLFNNLSALVQASPYFTTESYVPNSIISKQKYLANIKVHHDSYLNAIKDCTNKHQVILIMDYLFPPDFILEQDPKILKFPMSIGVKYLQNDPGILDRIIILNPKFQKLNQIINENIKEFKVGPAGERLKKVAESLSNLCNKDHKCKFALVNFIGLDVGIRWSEDDIYNAIRSKVCLKKDLAKLKDFVGKIDKVVRNQHPNIQAVYPLDAYNTLSSADQLKLKISKKHSKFLEGYIDEICEEILNGKINQLRIKRLVEEFVTTFNINSFTIRGINLFTAVIDCLKSIKSDSPNSADHARMQAASFEIGGMVVAMLEERGGCYMELSTEVINNVLPHTNLVAMHKKMFEPTTKVVSPELLKMHWMTF